MKNEYLLMDLPDDGFVSMLKDDGIKIYNFKKEKKK
jgi:hypothetical protein